MVLVDTSVWIDHLRNNNRVLSQLLLQTQVFCHPMIIGELACGNLNNRKQILLFWENMPALPQASHQEVLYLIEENHLMGKGLGYIDIHLLAACLLRPKTLLWTLDKRLDKLAQSFGIGFSQA